MDAGSRKRFRVLNWLPVMALALIYLAHLLVVTHYAVNVPWWDEWAMLRPDGLATDPSLTWLWQRHNEHRIVLTKLLIWLLYRADGWNHVTNQVINFFFFGGLLTCVIWFARTVTNLAFSTICAFVIFLLSTANYVNHAWGLQNHVHFALVLLTLSILFLFSDRPPSSRETALGASLASLAIFSSAIGVVGVAMMLPIFLLHCQRSYGEGWPRWRTLAIGVTPIAVAIALWLRHYQPPAQESTWATLANENLWRFFLNLVSWGFGVDRQSDTAGVFCLLLVLVPMLGHLVRQRLQSPPRTYALLAETLAIFAILASIAKGRLPFGMDQAKASRFAEIANLLVLLAACWWSLLLKARIRTLVLSALWLFCFACFSNNWGLAGYCWLHDWKVAGIDCARRYYKAGGGEADCPTLYPNAFFPGEPFAERLQRAKELNLSFYRSLATSDGAEHGRR
jgi:hypothetical protein